jgi:RibD C-terminal domain
MSIVFASLGMSLDGFIAGPNAGPDNSLGDGGGRIHASDPPPFRAPGGAGTWAQFLKKGLLDQLEIHLAAVLLGGGIRLFDRVEAGKLALEPERVVESPAVTHVRYRVTSSHRRPRRSRLRREQVG